MDNLATARLQVQGLLSEIKARRASIRIASLTAKEAQDIRLSMLRKLGEVLDELFAVRNAKELAAEGQMHVYRAMTAMARIREALLSNASLDEIQIQKHRSREDSIAAGQSSRPYRTLRFSRWDRTESSPLSPLCNITPYLHRMSFTPRLLS